MEFLNTLTLKDFIVGSITVLSVVVEFSKKIPFNPWTFLISHLGGALNSGIEKKLEELEVRQHTNNEVINEVKKEISTLKSEMETKFDESAKEADTKEAKRLRSDIISFADSCRIHQRHTKTAFENITRDYDDYIDYCGRHDIPNHFIDAEFEYIKSVYAECQEENKFI